MITTEEYLGRFELLFERIAKALEKIANDDSKSHKMTMSDFLENGIITEDVRLFMGGDED